MNDGIASNARLWLVPCMTGTHGEFLICVGLRFSEL